MVLPLEIQMQERQSLRNSVDSDSEYGESGALVKLSDTNRQLQSTDDTLIKNMGYSPTLHRGLGTMMNFAFGFTEVAILSSISITFELGLTNGGPVVIIWGFIVQFAAVMAIAHSMAEICAAYPCVGSVYHWAGQLASPEHAPLWSYITGILNFIGNGLGDASFAYGWASFVSAGVVAMNGNELTLGQQVGISIGVLFVWSVLNCFRVDQVGWINNIAAVFQISSIFLVFILLLAKTATLSPASYVFTAYVNKSGTPPFQNVGYVVATGITSSLFSFVGYEASAHMAEETENSSESAPKGIIYTCLSAGIGGLLIIFALLAAYNEQNVDDYQLAGTGNIVVDIFLYTTGSACGQFLTWLVVINLWFAGLSSVAVTGRITYALTRDGAFAFSDWLSQVDPTVKSPIRAIMFVFAFDAVFLLLPLDKDSALAFFAIIGLSVLGFQVRVHRIINLYPYCIRRHLFISSHFFVVIICNSNHVKNDLSAALLPKYTHVIRQMVGSTGCNLLYLVIW